MRLLEANQKGNLVMEINRFRIFNSLFWSYSERIIAQLVSFTVSIILARLIAPSEYGIISLVTIFITIANTFVTDGFGSALIQKKDADELDFSSVFYFSILVSLGLYIVIFIFSPVVASYFRISEITVVMRIMAFRIPLAAANSIQRAFVSKRMEFRKFFFSTFIGTFLSAVLGISLAFAGAGVWALVAQYLTNSLVDTVVLFFTSGWKPRIQFSIVRLKPLVSFGVKILLAALMVNIYTNLRNFIIGKRFSSKELAFSNKGEQFPNLITVNINSSITSVIFSVLSQQQSNREVVLSMTRRAIKTGTFLLAPTLLGLAAVSDKVVEALLTEAWLPCVPYLQIMCMVYLLQPIQTASLQAMKAMGEGRLYLKLEIIKKMVALIILFISVCFFHSVMAIIIGALISELLVTLINVPANSYLFKYKASDQMKDVLFPLLAAHIMAVVVYFCDQNLKENYWIILEIIIGVFVYVGISYVLKIDSLPYIYNILLRYVRRQKNNME